MNKAVSVVRVTRATPILQLGVADDTPDLKRAMIRLDIPSRLYVSLVSAADALDILKIIGSLVMVNNLNVIKNMINKVFNSQLQNTARRFATFKQYLKPLLGKALTVKGLHPPPPSTTNTSWATTTIRTMESNDI